MVAPMRKGLALALLVTAAATVAAPITVNPNVRYEFSNCSSGGSAATSVTAGSYVFRVFDEDTHICYASTCATGGERWPVGTVLHLRVQATTDVSCRSSGSTGDAVFTRGE